MGKLTVVTQDEPVRRQELLVQDGLDIALVAFLVSIHEDNVKGTAQGLQGILSRTLNQSDTIVESVFVKGATRRGDHRRVQFQSNNLSLCGNGTFVPGQGAVAGVAANLKDYS